MLDALFGWVLSFLGLLPFVHVNVILAAIRFGATPVLVGVLAFSHVVFSSLPGVLFGVPSSDHGVSLLASHALVQKGHGKTALWAVLLGLLAGLLGAVLLYPVFSLVAPFFQGVFRSFTGWLLLGVVVLALALDGFRLKHVFGFFLCSALGAFSLGLPLSDGLFPLLSGLFGVPALLLSEKGAFVLGGPAPRVPWAAALLVSVFGALAVFLPAVSPSYLAAVAFIFLESTPASFLVVSSALASSKMFYDFAAVSVLGKARSAAASVWLEQGVLAQDSAGLLAFGLAAFVVSWVLVALFWKPLVGCMAFCSHSLFRFFLLAVLGFGAFWAGGFWGLFVLVWSSFASLCLLSFSVPRKYALGALLGPAIGFAFGWSGFF